MQEKRTAAGGAPSMGNSALCVCECGRLGLWEVRRAGRAGQGAIGDVGGFVGGCAEDGRWEADRGTA